MRVGAACGGGGPHSCPWGVGETPAPTTSGCGLEEIENGLCNIIVRSCGASTAGTRAGRDWGAALCFP